MRPANKHAARWRPSSRFGHRDAWEATANRMPAPCPGRLSRRSYRSPAGSLRATSHPNSTRISTCLVGASHRPGFVPAQAAGRPYPLGAGTPYPTSAFTCPRPPLTGTGPARGGTRAPFDIDLAAWKPDRITRLPDHTGRLHPIPSTPVGWSRCRPMRAPNDASRQLAWPAAHKRGPNWSCAAGLG